MSLLMDALRKAEESKRKAEQNPDATEAAAGPAAEASAVGKTPAPQPPEDASQASASAPPPRPPIPDTPIEFSDSTSSASDESVTAAMTAPAVPAAEPEPVATVTAPAEEPEHEEGDWQLEPFDAGLGRVSRQPIQDKLPGGDELELDVRMDLPPVAPSDAAAKPPPQLAPTLGYKPGPASPPRPAQLSSPQVPSATAPAAKAPTARSPQPTVPRPRSDQGSSKLAGQNEPAAKAKQRKQQAAARNLFSAKLPGTRKQVLLFGAGIAALLFIGLGYFLFASLGSNSSGINVPTNYVAGSQGMSDSFEPTPEESPAVTVTDGVADTSTSASASTATTVAGSAVPPGSIDGIASLAVDSAPVTIEEIIAASPDLQPLPDTSPLAPEPTPAAPVPVQTATAVAAPADEADTATADIVAADVDSAATTVTGTQQADATMDTAVSAAPALAETINFSRSAAADPTTPLLNSAYRAYLEGDLEQARSDYQQVLQEAPLHRDALLGLAAIATRQQQPNQAMELYSRLLARNPNDPVAWAALLDLNPEGGPAQQERELRRLLELHPGVAPLQFALGNFYASRQQWSDAQQYYFNALSLARSDLVRGGEIYPDYAFNLAVSLEHLGQAPAAVSFYRQALDQARRAQAGFDIEAARARLQVLEATP